MDYEYAPLRLPSNVDRLTAAAQLAIQAEFSGWELAQVQLFRDGTRQVMLRRRRSATAHSPASATERARPARSGRVRFVLPASVVVAGVVLVVVGQERVLVEPADQQVVRGRRRTARRRPRPRTPPGRAARPPR